MAKLSAALAHIIENDPPLTFGIHHRLLNLSELARFLRPLIEARVGRKLSHAAVLMALSRRQSGGRGDRARRPARLRLRSIESRTGLILIPLKRTRAHQRGVNAAVMRLLPRGDYFNLSEGTGELCLIVHRDSLREIEGLVPVPPGAAKHTVAALIIRFDQAYVARPGFLYLILQQLALQQISVRELASTTTEFIVYIDDRDLEMARSSLERRFSVARPATKFS